MTKSNCGQRRNTCGLQMQNETEFNHVKGSIGIYLFIHVLLFQSYNQLGLHAHQSISFIISMHY